MKKIIITIICTAIITSVFSLSFSYAATNYAISANKIGYSDNSNLGVTDVQAAIDGTCTKFSTKLNSIMEQVYPVGSIYISTSISDSNVVASTLGVGKWEAYGTGKALVGVDPNDSLFNVVEKTGGSKSNSITLSTANLPSHTHTISHTHTTPETNTSKMSLTALTAGSHNHDISYFGYTGETSTEYKYGIGWGYFASRTVKTDTGGAHSHKVTGYVTIPSLSTTTQSTTTSGSTGEGKAFTTSTMQPYVTVYMYKRTA